MCWLWCFTVRGLLNALKIQTPGSGTTRLPRGRHVSEGLNSQQCHCENLKSNKGGGDVDDNCSFNTCSSLLIYLMTVLSDDQLQSHETSCKLEKKNKRKTVEQKFN